MAATDRTTLKSYFETDDRPTQAQFESLIDTLGPDGLYTLGTAMVSKTGIYSITSETNVTAYSPGSAGLGVIQASSYNDIHENTTVLTTLGDLLKRGASSDTRLALGDKKTVLTSKDGDVTYARINTSAFATSIDTIGTIFIRATANWGKLTPGAENTVLKSVGTSAMPVWGSAQPTKYASTYQAFTVATTYSFNHGLGQHPDFISLHLKCIATAGDANFTQNQIVYIPLNMSVQVSSTSPLASALISPTGYFPSTASVAIVMPNNILTQNPSTEGQQVELDETLWQMQVRAAVL